MKKTISFEIELDENHLAEKIKMSSADSDKDIDKIKSILVSMWDSNQKNSLNISLWTKDMPLNDMFIFYHQTLITMAKNLEKATDNQKVSTALVNFAEKFAKLSNILKRFKSFFYRRKNFFTTNFF